MKRGSDYEAELFSQIMPIIVCDIFPPADILNRLLAAFMSARPFVAFCLTPTIFRVRINEYLDVFHRDVESNAFHSIPFNRYRVPLRYINYRSVLQVFSSVRYQNQQSLVVEWILLSLENFTKVTESEIDEAVWNILCFFTAASANPWLQLV